MKSLVLMCKPLIFSVFLLLTQHLSAQSDLEALEKSGLKEVFKSTFQLDQEIDSIRITYYDYKISYFDIYRGLRSKGGSASVGIKILDLNYGGDLLLLRNRFPALYEGVMSPKLLQENWKRTEKSLDVTITQKSVRFSKAGGLLVATAKPAKIKALEAYLTKNYDASITPPADSILIIQTIVEKESGSLGQKEILRGEKGAFFMILFLGKI